MFSICVLILSWFLALGKIPGLTGFKPQAANAAVYFGKLRKGAPQKTKTVKGKEVKVVGSDLSYFRLDLLDHFADLAPVFHKIYGDEPHGFEHVMLFGRDTDSVFPTYLEAWSYDRLKVRVDGVWVIAAWDDKTNKVVKYPAGGHGSRLYNESEWLDSKGNPPGPIGRLLVVLPEFCAAVGTLGYFMIDISSKYELVEIDKFLRGVEALNGGSLPENMVYTLGRADRPVDMRYDGKTRKETRSLIYLHMSGRAVTNYLSQVPDIADQLTPGIGVAGQLPAVVDPDQDIIDGDAPGHDPDTGEILPSWAEPVPFDIKSDNSFIEWIMGMLPVEAEGVHAVVNMFGGTHPSDLNGRVTRREFMVAMVGYIIKGADPAGFYAAFPDFAILADDVEGLKND